MKKLSNVERVAPGSIREFVKIWTTAESAGPGIEHRGGEGVGDPRGSSSALGYKKVYRRKWLWAILFGCESIFWPFCE